MASTSPTSRLLSHGENPNPDPIRTRTQTLPQLWRQPPDLTTSAARSCAGMGGKRRPAPQYYEVDVSLEELYTGCVKTVDHHRARPDGSRQEIELRIAVTPAHTLAWPRAGPPNVC